MSLCRKQARVGSGYYKSRLITTKQNKPTFVPFLVFAGCYLHHYVPPLRKIIVYLFTVRNKIKWRLFFFFFVSVKGIAVPNVLILAEN